MKRKLSNIIIGFKFGAQYPDYSAPFWTRIMII